MVVCYNVVKKLLTQKEIVMQTQTSYQTNSNKQSPKPLLYDAVESSVRTFVYDQFLQPEQKLPVASRPSLFLSVNLNAAMYMHAKQQVKDLSSDSEIVQAVTNTVLHFFGGTNVANNKTRLSIYQNNMPVCPLSAFVGKDASECAERASAAHNLFHYFGLQSYLLNGPILLNGNPQTHYYNIVELNKKHYLYDLAVCPTKQTSNGLKKLPMLKELSKQEIAFLKEGNQHNLNQAMEPISFCTASGNQYEVCYGSYEPTKTM